MATLRRFFSKRFTDSKESKEKGDLIPCIVENLEESENTFNIHKKDLASVLYENVYSHLSLKDEKDYFGLQYTDVRNINHWLDPTKPVKKQCKIGPPFTLRLRVKFYSTDPSKLLDELPRYFFVCQLKKDLRNGRLKCDLESAVELAAYLLQGELGDYNETDHDLALISSYRFLPDDQQTEEFEEAVLEKYKSLRGRSLTPATVDKLFLVKAKDLPDYGVDRHEVVGKDGNTYTLGITAGGILVYEGENKIGLFLWENMRKLEFKGKILRIIGTDKDESGNVVEHEFLFKILTKRACKHLWKCAMEHHCFFRLSEPPPPPTRLQQLFRLRSSFHGSFRYTERGMLDNQNKGIPIGTSHQRSRSFARTPSKRYDPRESFLNRSRSLTLSSDAAYISRPGGNTIVTNPDIHSLTLNSDRHSSSERRPPSTSVNKSANEPPSWRHPIFPSTKPSSIYEDTNNVVNTTNQGDKSDQRVLRPQQQTVEKRKLESSSRGGAGGMGSVDMHRPIRHRHPRKQSPASSSYVNTNSLFLQTSTPTKVAMYLSSTTGRTPSASSAAAAVAGTTV